MKKVKPVIELIVKYDHAPIRGNAIDSGDEEYDREVEDQLIDEVNSGNVWAWFSAEIKASYNGVSCSDYLGCCSYEDEQDFRASDCYQDMVAQATDELREKLKGLQGLEIE
jgi:hypothetical protein